MTPWSHRKACRPPEAVPLDPTTWPKLLIALARLVSPPRVPRSMMVRDAAVAGAARATTRIAATIATGRMIEALLMVRSVPQRSNGADTSH